MTSILEKLYYGEISPCSLPTPTTERYFKAKNEVERYGKDILAKYPDCKELLENYADAIHITAACEGLQDFEEGFKLGAAFMIEIYRTKIKSFAEAKQLIDDYIFIYNHQRIQLNTKLTPLELRSQFVA